MIHIASRWKEERKYQYCNFNLQKNYAQKAFSNSSIVNNTFYFVTKDLTEEGEAQNNSTRNKVFRLFVYSILLTM